QDVLSGIASCDGPTVLHQGAEQSVTGHATDAADNSTTATANHINVDETDPVITGAVTAPPNANGWYNDDVTVHWTCSDALSGLAVHACPADSLVAGEGDNLSATAHVEDVAGNSASATVSDLRIDRTRPVTTALVSPDPTSDNGWYAAAPMVSLTAA